MPDIDFQFAWQKSDPDFVRDARAFWLRLRVLDEDQIDERVAQLCALAYSGSQLAAISTVDFFDFPRMRGRFFYYRTTVAPEFRRQAVAAKLCRFSFLRLAEWADAHPEHNIKGLVMTFESSDLFVTRRSQPIITTEGLDFVFVGYSPDAQQIRIVWFDDATID